MSIRYGVFAKVASMSELQVLWTCGNENTDASDWRDLYLNADRSGRSPWTILNMVQSLDGGVTSDDVSADLGSPADQEIFRTLRSLADVILVGAETVRKEDYGPPKLTAELREQRKSRGQRPLPEIAVVSASLALDPKSRLFEDGHKPVIFTCSGTQETLSKVAEVIVLEGAEAPEPTSALEGEVTKRESSDAGMAVDLSAVRKALGERGHKIILCEGGPTLNAQLVAKDLIDEFCISLSPAFLGGNPLRLLEGTPLLAKNLALLSVATDKALLFLRYGQQPHTSAN